MAFARLSDTAVIVHGPASCAYLMDSAYLSTVADLYIGGVYQHPMSDNIYSTRMDDGSAIFGGAEKLKSTLESAYDDGYREAVVITTCVSGMIGDDCAAAIRDFTSGHPDCSVQLIPTDGVMAGDYFEGMEESMSTLVGLIDPGVGMEGRSVNLIGTTFFDLQTAEAAFELGKMLSVFGVEVNCRLLDETSMSSIRGFCRASADILMNEASASGLLDTVRSATGRDAPVLRMPTGIYEYGGWLLRMAEIFGDKESAEAEIASARQIYSRFIEEHRAEFEGRKVAVSACIDRDVDWLLDMLEDLGAEVVRFGYLKPPDFPGSVTSRHRDMLVFRYGKEAMMEDWNTMHPDLLVFDVDLPDDYPGRTVRMSRIGPGIRSALVFMESVGRVLSRPVDGGDE